MKKFKPNPTILMNSSQGLNSSFSTKPTSYPLSGISHLNSEDPIHTENNAEVNPKNNFFPNLPLQTPNSFNPTQLNQISNTSLNSNPNHTSIINAIIPNNKFLGSQAQNNVN